MIELLPLVDAKLILLTQKADNRGWFLETFRQTWIEEFGISQNFIFDFSSYNIHTGTLRGLHSQKEDMNPAKLVQVLSGSIQDIIVDARMSSPTYGKNISVILKAQDPKLLYVPRGFYHGFVTLEPNTLVSYKVDQYHSAEKECGVAWNDPILDLDWAIKENLIISDRDQNNPSWDLANKF